MDIIKWFLSPSALVVFGSLGVLSIAVKKVWGNYATDKTDETK
ncbi:hypothetical protein [Paenibacillus sp. FSL K6-2859]